jgi:hypothetical protein
MPFDRKVYNRAWRRANADRIKAYQARYIEANVERLKAQQKAYREANAERIKAIMKPYREVNAERLKAQTKAYKEANAERLKEYDRANVERTTIRRKAWYQANREKQSLRRKEYLDANPEQKLAARYRTSIYQRLASQNTRKSDMNIVLLGCDMQWLVAWLEIQFKPGMTWENYGPVWHVDHKRPCNSFDLSDPAQQRLCFHWTNLQPLFARENQEKGPRWKEAA